MPRLIRLVLVLAAGVLLASEGAEASLIDPADCQVPCAMVLVGHNQAGVVDAYGAFSVVIVDIGLNRVSGATVKVDFSACCPSIVLSDTQHGLGVSHEPGSAIVTALTDQTGTARFVIEGAGRQGAGPNTGLVGLTGCAEISVAYMDSGPWWVITEDIYHPHPKVCTPDENGAAGAPGVDITDLSVFISDKNAFYHDTAQYRQRSDFDFHLPVFNCWSAPNLTQGLGDNLGDLSQWIMIKNAAASLFNGPFPANCP
jgi:hypothetical protein